MAATFAIVYATNSKMHRRTIADDDGQITLGLMPDGLSQAVICSHPNAPPSYHPLLPGESALIETASGQVEGAHYYDWLASIQKATGVAPAEIYCALVDKTNTVAHIIKADPEIDAVPPGFTMVRCHAPDIKVGHAYNPGNGHFTEPAGVIPPGMPGNRSAAPLHVPARTITNDPVIPTAVP